MARDPECVFCKIVAGVLPALVVVKDEVGMAFLDIGPLADGHLLLVPINHYANLSDMPGEEIASLVSHVPRLGKALLTVTGADGFNMLVNEGRVAGQVVPHVHFHLIPRVAGDGLGYRWKAKDYPEGRAQELLGAYHRVLAGPKE